MSNSPEDKALRKDISKMIKGISTGYHSEDGVDYIMHLITLHTQRCELEARLNGLTHRANDAIERMYRLDKEYAGNYIQNMRWFYSIYPTEAGE